VVQHVPVSSPVSARSRPPPDGGTGLDKLDRMSGSRPARIGRVQAFFLILEEASAPAGVATAAAITTTSAPRSSRMASRSSTADPTRTTAHRPGRPGRRCAGDQRHLGAARAATGAGVALLAGRAVAQVATGSRASRVRRGDDDPAASRSTGQRRRGGRTQPGQSTISAALGQPALAGVLAGPAAAGRSAPITPRSAGWPRWPGVAGASTSRCASPAPISTGQRA